MATSRGPDQAQLSWGRGDFFAGGTTAAAQVGRSPSGRQNVAEVLLQFTDPVELEGVPYLARVCGAEAGDGHWHGWIEFTSVDDGEVIRSSRETTQPNREDTVYWATGLSRVFLEGSLRRTLNPRTRRAAPGPVRPRFDEPAPDAVEPPRPAESILDPFSVY